MAKLGNHLKYIILIYYEFNIGFLNKFVTLRSYGGTFRRQLEGSFSFKLVGSIYLKCC